MTRTIKHNSVWVLLPLLLMLFFSSCSNERRLARGKPLRQRSPAFLVNHNVKNSLHYDWVGMKLSVDFKNPERSESFRANVKMKKDSIIWMSISPALGIEMLRLVITPDSVKYISKIPDNKYYYLGDFSVISDLAKMDLSFDMIQDLLLGNAIMLDKQDDKLNSRIDKQQYFLVSKFHRRLKKLIGVDDKNILPNHEININPLSKEYQKAKRKSKKEDLMVKRFWLNGKHYKIERELFNDLYNFRDIEITYRDFEKVDGQLFPDECRLRVSSPDDWQEIEFEITRIRLNKEYELSFEIPEDYERKHD